MRLRLLPVVLFAGGLLLTVRVGALWQDITVDAGRDSAAETTADAPAEAGPAAGAPAEPAGALPESAASEESPSPGTENLLASAPVDPLSFTDQELELLQSLAARRDELVARERELAEREALAAAAERRIDDKVAQLRQLQSVIEGLVQQHDETQEAQLGSLVKIYENMKPKDAAQIFEELELDVLLDVIDRMKERKVAPVLALMDPSKAQEVTIELAQRRALPLPR